MPLCGDDDRSGTSPIDILLLDAPASMRSALQDELGDAARLSCSAASLTDGPVTAASDAAVVVHFLGGGATDRDRLLRSTLGTWNILGAMTSGLYLQVSTMRVMAGYEDGWDLDESWLPRPALDSFTLACHLGEIAGRELTRAHGVATRVLRLDEVGEEVQPPALPPGRWLHPHDAARALAAVIRAAPAAAPGSWQPLHGVRGGGRYRLAALGDMGFAPEHDVLDTGPVPVPRSATAKRPLLAPSRPQRITVFGAGGPLGVAAAHELMDRQRVCLTDSMPLPELIARAPQSPGAPTLGALPEPLAFEIADVSSAESVSAAAADSDCLVNCAVVRQDPHAAFMVNVVGSWNIMNAARMHGIRKVVFTGPTLSIAPYPFSSWDRDVDGTQHHRSIGSVYYLTKLLGYELTRVLAEAHEIATPALLWADFLPADAITPDAPSPRPATDFCITWEDAGRAIRAAVDVTTLPEASPVIQILAPSPTGRWVSDRARDLLGFEPQTDLSACWWDRRVSVDATGQSM